MLYQKLVLVVAVGCCWYLRGGLRNPDETTGRYFKGRGRRYTGQEEGAHICFTAQSGSGIPRSPYQIENELLRSSF